MGLMLARAANAVSTPSMQVALGIAAGTTVATGLHLAGRYTYAGNYPQREPDLPPSGKFVLTAIGAGAATLYAINGTKVGNRPLAIGAIGGAALGTLLVGAMVEKALAG